MFFKIKDQEKDAFLKDCFNIEHVQKKAKKQNVTVSLYLFELIDIMIRYIKDAELCSLFTDCQDNLPLWGGFFPIDDVLTDDVRHPLFKPKNSYDFATKMKFCSKSCKKIEMELFDIFSYLYYVIMTSKLCFAALIKNDVELKNTYPNTVLSLIHEIESIIHTALSPKVTLTAVHINEKFTEQITDEFSLSKLQTIDADWLTIARAPTECGKL